MPKGSAVEDVESKLKAEYPGNARAIYGTLNKIGLMHGNKPTQKGLRPAHSGNNLAALHRHLKRG